jgi:hypothetical protein
VESISGLLAKTSEKSPYIVVGSAPSNALYGDFCLSISNNRKLTLRQRIKEIFEYYSEVISICGPVLSLFDNNKLHKWINQRGVNPHVKSKLVKIIDMKVDADSETIPQRRKSKYDMIVNFVKNEGQYVWYEIVSFVNSY